MEQRAVSEFLAAAAVEPAALVLEGDAGIGKTTVWLDAMERAREAGFRVLSTRIAETESVLAYAGLAALLEGVELAAFEALPPPQRLAMDRVLLRISAEGPMTDQRAVNAGVVSVLEHLAHQSPVLVAIDDLQWLDQPSLQIVSSVARRLRGSIGVLAAVRTGPDSTRLGSWLELPRPDRLQRVALRPLSLGALHTVVSERVGRSFSRPKMHEIHQVSGGNPFYAVELARAIDDGAWDDRASLPGSLAELVRARIDSLTVGARTALLAAACLADPTVEVVARATGTGTDEIVTSLEEAEDKGIIGIDGHRLYFSHPLLVRGIYSESTPADRRRCTGSSPRSSMNPSSGPDTSPWPPPAGTPSPAVARLGCSDGPSERPRPQPSCSSWPSASAVTPRASNLSAANHFEAGDRGRPVAIGADHRGTRSVRSRGGDEVARDRAAHDDSFGRHTPDGLGLPTTGLLRQMAVMLGYALSSGAGPMSEANPSTEASRASSSARKRRRPPELPCTSSSRSRSRRTKWRLRSSMPTHRGRLRSCAIGQAYPPCASPRPSAPSSPRRASRSRGPPAPVRGRSAPECPSCPACVRRGDLGVRDARRPAPVSRE